MCLVSQDSELQHWFLNLPKPGYKLTFLRLSWIRSMFLTNARINHISMPYQNPSPSRSLTTFTLYSAILRISSSGSGSS